LIIFVRTSQSKTILVGGGQNSETIRELTKVMPFYKRKIDYLVLPSAVPAQIGGLIEIVDRYEIDNVIMPKVMATSTVLDMLVKNIRKKKIHIGEVEKGDVVEVESGLVIDVLFPRADYKFNKSSLPELGFSVSYGSTSVFLIGNLSKTIQKDIASQLEVKTDQNLVEFYNGGGESKVSGDLIEKIKPKFTFTIKEKTVHFVSEGEGWVRME
jgi:competence protein ComEC